MFAIRETCSGVFFATMLVVVSACSNGGNSGGNGQGIGGGGGKPAGAAGSCAAPLVNGRSWCTSENEANGQSVVSIATFKTDCSGTIKRYRISAQGQGTELPVSNFTWSLADKILTVDPLNGNPAAKSEIEFDAKQESFVADKIVFNACTVEPAKK